VVCALTGRRHQWEGEGVVEVAEEMVRDELLGGVELAVSH
jgi:hypothetical protein